MKNHQSDNISALIVKYVLGNISNEEHKVLESWRNSSVRNEKLFQELCNEENLITRLKNYHWSDVEKAYHLVKAKANNSRKSRVKTINWRMVSSVAAVFVGVLLVFSYLFFQDVLDNNRLADNKEIGPGKQSAELILSDGSVVKLGTTLDAILEKDGTQVFADSGSIQYLTDEDGGSEYLYNEVRVGHGEEFQLILADGTKVWLNSMSSIKFPVQFSDKIRSVEVIGEIYLEVEHDDIKPFIVHTPIYDIRVLGTAFNVSCYADEEMVHTTLVDGKIQIDNILGKEDEIFVTPGQQFVYDRTDNGVFVQEVNTASYVSWTKGYFQFSKNSLDEMFIELARWYPIEVEYATADVREKLITGKLPRFENIETLLNLIEKISEVEFEVVENKIIVK
ncbi:FecR family protein [Carboxylicivirga sp. RSCT41]|uniref:FecR family protein n=1 Tax=Carboxylicivirga agarovorans TaxID=3417570 RepID=UPI003D33A020